MVRLDLPLNESAPVEQARLKDSEWLTAQSVASRSDHRSVTLGCPCYQRRRYFVTRSCSLLLSRPWLLQTIEPERR
jgi:hypothetical protein